MINQIQEETGAQISIENDGAVYFPRPTAPRPTRRGRWSTRIAVASLAALVGVFLVLDSRAADGRLVLAGQPRATLLLNRTLLVLAATGSPRSACSPSRRPSSSPASGVSTQGGNVLLAVTYAFIGMLLGPVFGRISSVFLAFLLPFLDLGISQSPMLRGEPDTWARWLPGYGGTRVVLAGALTSSLEESAPLISSVGWVAVLGLAAALIVAPSIRTRWRTHSHRVADRWVTNRDRRDTSQALFGFVGPDSTGVRRPGSGTREVPEALETVSNNPYLTTAASLRRNGYR